MILSVDPGRCAGWALWFDDGTLYQCGTARPPLFAAVPYPCEILVIEKPHSGRGKASKSNIITLSRRMEKLIGLARAGKVIEVGPSTWKGSVPKPISTQRIKDALTPHELSVVKQFSPRMNHNCLDAVGLGKWYFSSRVRA